eukprot:1157880-Pelagomonas_calceolata.AAC.6
MPGPQTTGTTLHLPYIPASARYLAFSITAYTTPPYSLQLSAETAFHTIHPGVGGTIYTIYTAHALDQSYIPGNDPQRSTKLERNLHAHSVQYTQKHTSTWRAIALPIVILVPWGRVLAETHQTHASFPLALCNGCHGLISKENEKASSKGLTETVAPFGDQRALRPKLDTASPGGSQKEPLRANGDCVIVYYVDEITLYTIPLVNRDRPAVVYQGSFRGGGAGRAAVESRRRKSGRPGAWRTTL